jgi:hypothetical protein
MAVIGLTETDFLPFAQGFGEKKVELFSSE